MANGDGGGGFFFLVKLFSITCHQKPLSPWKLKTPNLYSHYYNNNSSIVIPGGSRRRSCNINITAMSSPWESNAETIGAQRFKFKFRDKNKNIHKNGDVGREQQEEERRSGRKGQKRRWWSGEPPDMEEEEEEPGILEEVIDSIWIYKVFKSYGWTLPPIILSLLLSTGPKAFLMVLGLSLGQSALTFVFQKLFGIRPQSKRKHKPRKGRKPSATANTQSSVGIDDEEQEEKQETVKTEMGYKSWVVEDNGSVNKDTQDAPQFGGWDELDRTGSMQQRPSRMASQSQRTPLANGKLSNRGRKSDTPLLLRLLIAVFPFLGSWTKMLW